MRGFTVFELLIVMVVGGILLAVAVPRARLTLDRLAVQGAADDVRATLFTARSFALAGASRIVVDIDSAAGAMHVRRGSEVLLSRGVGAAHGVRIARNRDSLSYDGFGLGLGAINLSIVVRRGAAVETVFVSRMGRVR
jgi:prepilin-type N-terminal cleavage/methylation domain-containing protein